MTAIQWTQIVSIVLNILAGTAYLIAIHLVRKTIKRYQELLANTEKMHIQAAEFHNALMERAHALHLDVSQIPRQELH